MYNHADDSNVINEIRIDQNDLFIIYYLVQMLEEMKDNEQMVLLTLNVLLMPVVLALHPENYALEPE